jgi:predicted metal-binding membrane protein
VHGFRQRGIRVSATLRWWPEWRVGIVVALAWIALLAGVGRSSGEARHTEGVMATAGLTSQDQQAHDEHHARAMVADVAHRDPQLAPGGVLADLPGWGLMAVAMMAPVTLPAVRHVGLNSIRRRRQWAMALYFAVYVGVWVAFGVLALAGERVVRQTLALHGDGLLALILAMAAWWQLTHFKRRAIFRCRRTVPLPPVGLRADAGCARFALQQGWRCVTSCWAFMALMVVVGHSGLMWMTALTSVIVVEELTTFGRRLLQPSAAGLALAAALVALTV